MGAMDGKRRRSPAYMSRSRKEQLILFVAGSGENYDRYLTWVAANPDVRQFTRYYFRVWVQRHREAIRMARGYVREWIANVSTLDKQARIEMLEATAARCNVLLLTNLSVEQQLRVEEQLRKTLESIAKERGEYNESPDVQKHDAIGAVLAGLLPAMNSLPKPIPQPPVLPPVLINGATGALIDDEDDDDG